MTHYLRTQWLRTANVCYLTVSVDQKFRRLAEATVRMWVGAAGLIGARGLPFRMVQSHACWQEASVPHHVGLSVGLLECPQHGNQQVPDLLIKERTRQPPQCLFCPSLRRDIHHICRTLLVTQANADTVWEGPHKGMNVRKRDQYHWSFWRLAAFAFS